MALPKLTGTGFLYWGVERNADGRPLKIAWMTQMEPPFRHGKAVRVRLGSRAFHFGVCRKAPKPFVRPTSTTAEEIGKWVS